MEFDYAELRSPWQPTHWREKWTNLPKLRKIFDFLNVNCTITVLQKLENVISGDISFVELEL